MFKLLQVELYTLTKMKAFKLSVLGAIILSILLNVQYITDKTPAFESFFNGVLVLNLIAVAIGGLIINNDYAQNTIRNKVVIGYSRTSIFVAKTLLILLYYIIIFVVAFIPSLYIHCFMLETENVIWEAVWKGFALSGLNIVNNVAITILLGMSVKNVAGVVLPVFLAEAIPVSGMLILEVLSVSNAKKMFEFVQAIPNIEIMMLSPYTVPANMGLSLIITGVFTTFCLLLSWHVFNTAELN